MGAEGPGKGKEAISSQENIPFLGYLQSIVLEICTARPLDGLSFSDVFSRFL
jgi:hypothetical protein